jgi:N-acetylneuraminic acid mutarotase
MRHSIAITMPIGMAFGTLASIFVLAAAPAHAQSASSPGVWTQKTPMPALRGEVAAAVVGDKLYALGGSVNRQAVARNEEYDPATDRWRERAPLPQPRDHLGVAVLDGKIYAFGGFTSSVHQGSTNVVFEYNPATDFWRPLPR